MRERNRRLLERCKTIAIVLLAVIAVPMILMLQPFTGSDGSPAGALRSLLTQVGAAGTAAADSGLRASDGANLPLRLAWYGAAGRCGYQYGSGSIESVFQPVATLLGEALGSATNVVESSDFRTRALLGRNSLYLDYGGSIPVSVLANWYGVQKPAALPELSVRRVILAAEGDGTVLCLIGNGGIWVAETAVRFANLESVLGGLTPNGAAFAFEMDGVYEKLGDYTLLSGELPALHAQQASSPLNSEEGQQRLLKALGFNPNSEAQYEETDGTRVTVETDGVLRYTAAGAVTYRGTVSDGVARLTVGEADSVTAAQIVAWAANLFEECLGSAERNTYLLSVSTAEDSITVTFGYELNGIPVRLAGNVPALRLTVTGGAVTQLELQLYQFTDSGAVVTLLPERLAAAAVSAGAEPTVVYAEENGLLTPTWVRAD